MGTVDLKVVQCAGNPREMGRQYGEQARAEILANAAFWQCETHADAASAFAQRTVGLLSQRAPAIRAELAGLAEGSGLSEDLLVLMNAWGGPVAVGCTSMAIGAGADGPVLGKNNDGQPDGRHFVFATNHYVSAALADADRRTVSGKEVSVYRYGYLRWVEQTGRPGNAADIEALLKSHEPWAPCRHGGVHLSHTLWSMIARPADRRLLVASGTPCCCAYREFGVDAV